MMFDCMQIQIRREILEMKGMYELLCNTKQLGQSMIHPKKTETIGPFRLDPDLKEKFDRAMAYYGISDAAGVARAVATALVAHARAKDQILLPVRFRAVAAVGEPPRCLVCGHRLRTWRSGKGDLNET